MKLKIGNQTAFAALSLVEPFEFALANGFEAFEFFPDRGPSGHAGWDERGVSFEERDYIRRAAEACDVTLTVHFPLAFDPLTDPNDSRLESTLAFANDIGAVLVNLHLDPRQGVEAFCEALGSTLKRARQARLKVALENTVWTGPADFNAFFDCLPSVHPRLARQVGMCFDLGHANACQATRNDYCGFIDQLHPSVPIIHAHLHENYGDRDSHLPLFTGPAMQDSAGIVGLLQRFKARGYDGCGILEQWPQPPELLTQARDRLAVLLGTLN